MENDEPCCSLLNIVKNDYFLNTNFKNSSLFTITCDLAFNIEQSNFKNFEGCYFNYKDNVLSFCYLDAEVNLCRIYSTIDDILNTGHYGSIEEKYRVFFAFVSALRAKLEFLKGDFFVCYKLI